MKFVGGAVVAVVFLSSCSFNASFGGKSLEEESVESEISEKLFELRGVTPKEVDCAGIEDLDVEEGNTFMCTGVAPNGDTFEVNLTLTDDEGGFEFMVP